MKKVMLFVAVLFSAACYGQSSPATQTTIYGCSPIDNNTLVKEKEVSLNDWFCYVYAISYTEDLENIDTLLPQVSNEYTAFVVTYFKRFWQEEYTDQKPTWIKHNMNQYPLVLSKTEKKDLKRIKRFCEMPVTGLTLQQVNDFLIWETEKLSSFEKLDEFQEYSIELTLPSVATYETLHHAAKKSSYLDSIQIKESVGDSVNLKGCPFFNFHSTTECETKEMRIKLYGTAIGPTEVFAYYPDKKGLYNILGNVSEMTSTAGVVFGGNYTQSANEILNAPKQTVALPNPLVGFRYVVNVVPYKN